MNTRMIKNQFSSIKQTVPTFYAKIYLGLNPGYEKGRDLSKAVERITRLHQKIQEYCNKTEVGVTIEPTKFTYVDGSEDGVVIGFIQYPRFPKPETTILKQAFELAEELMEEFDQFRCSVMTPDETFLLENEKKCNMEG